MDAISKNNPLLGHSMESNASFSEKLFTKPFTLSTVEIVLASAAVFLDGTYISVITMRISIFVCEVLSLGSVSAPSISHWSYTSDVSELCAFVPF